MVEIKSSCNDRWSTQTERSSAINATLQVVPSGIFRKAFIAAAMTLLTTFDNATIGERRRMHTITKLVGMREIQRNCDPPS